MSEQIPAGGCEASAARASTTKAFLVPAFERCVDAGSPIKPSTRYRMWPADRDREARRYGKMLRQRFRTKLFIVASGGLEEASALTTDRHAVVDTDQ